MNTKLNVIAPAYFFVAIKTSSHWRYNAIQALENAEAENENKSDSLENEENKENEDEEAASTFESQYLF